MKREFKLFGWIFIACGILLILNSSSGITGFVIFDNVSIKVGNVLGIVLVIAGMFIMLLERKGKESDLVASVREAMARGVPEEEAVKLYNESNKKVGSGEWVELKVETVRSTSDPKKHPHETSLCRYWGPKEYEGSSRKKIENLYDAGKIGKTHELLLGSAKWKLGGRLLEGTVSIPPIGSMVSHRHWEIEQMYKKQKKYK